MSRRSPPICAEIRGSREVNVLFRHKSRKRCPNVRRITYTRDAYAVKKRMHQYPFPEYDGTEYFMYRHDADGRLRIPEDDATCPACGTGQLFNNVSGRHNEKVPCNAKCTGATGPNCECSCGGANHGGSWQV